MHKRLGVIGLATVWTAMGSTAWAQPTSAASLFETRCINSANGAACYLAAMAYQRGTLGVSRDNSQAAMLHRRGCELGFASCCNELGFLTSEGLGVPADPAAAVALFQRACDGGSQPGCGNLGTMYATGSGVTRDTARAAPLLERGCTARHAASCGVLGVLYGRGDGVVRDTDRSRELLTRSCELGMPEACRAVGRTANTTAEVGSYPAPPPVTASESGDFAAPPSVVSPAPAPAPPSVVSAAPAPMIGSAVPSPQPRVIYRPTYTPSTNSGSSASSPVSFFGSANRFSFGFGYHLATGPSSAALSIDVFSLSFGVWRGPIEFDFSLAYGTGSSAVVPQWGALLTGASMGLQIVSWPRADRYSFSPINLSAGVSALLSISSIDQGSRFGLAPYVADTFYFTCALALRAEWAPYLVGEETYGWQFGLSFLIAPRRSYMCQ